MEQSLHAAAVAAMHVLVLDPAQLLPWQIGHALGPRVEIEAVTSLRAAERALRDGTPDVVVVSMSPARIDWLKFQRLCAEHDPPLPVLFESCIFESAADAGLAAGDGRVGFLRKPASPADLRCALERLFEGVRVARA